MCTQSLWSLNDNRSCLVHELDNNGMEDGCFCRLSLLLVLG